METPFHLHGKTILVTGASSGIGRAAAIAASRMGATIVVSGRDESRLRETFLQLDGAGHHLIIADLLTPEGQQLLAKNIPALDGLVHCAGAVKAFPVRFITQAQLDEMLKLNFDAPVLLSSALLRGKKINAGASLVYLSSISSEFPPKGGALYSAAKAALTTFVKTLAREHAPLHIRANTLSPGMVKTPMYERVEQDVTKEGLDQHMAQYPLGAGLPEDVANAAVFLLSPASRWITGINLILDGGFLTGT